MSADFLIAHARLNGILDSDDCIKICLSKEDLIQIAQQVVDKECRKSFFKRVLDAIKSLFFEKKGLLFEFAAAIVFYALQKKRGV